MSYCSKNSRFLRREEDEICEGRIKIVYNNFTTETINLGIFPNVEEASELLNRSSKLYKESGLCATVIPEIKFASSEDGKFHEIPNGSKNEVFEIAKETNASKMFGFSDVNNFSCCAKNEPIFSRQSTNVYDTNINFCYDNSNDEFSF